MSNNILQDDRPFDRLVDGELSEAERCELLGRIDSEPGGWRHCALAFLEAQCWKQTFGPIAQPRSAATTPEEAIRLSRSRWQTHLGTIMAMAACFLAAFLVGSMMKQSRVAGPGTPTEIAKSADRPHTLPIQLPSRPWQTVQVSAPTGSTLSLPARERANIDQQWLRNLPPAIPADVLQAFNRTGHQVEQHRELVPVPMKDGRRLVVPVDQVDVHYVGNNTY